MPEFNLCRICLMEGAELQSMKPLFDEKNRECGDLVRRIEEIGGIKLKPLMNVMSLLCCRCLDALDTAYKFRELCQASEHAFVDSFVKAEVKFEDVPHVDPNDIIFDMRTEFIDGVEVDISALAESNEEGIDEEHIQYADDEEDIDIHMDDEIDGNCDENGNDRIEDDEEDEDDAHANEDAIIESIDDIEFNENESENININYESQMDKVIVVNSENSNNNVDNDEDESECLYLANSSDSDYQPSSGKTKSKPKPKSKTRFSKRGRPRNVTTVGKITATFNGSKVTFDRHGNKITELSTGIMCEICGNIYTKRGALNMHMRRHMAEKPFACEICNKSFAGPSELNRHIRVHTGEKPFTCKFCNRSFADRSSNIRHERTHTNERPFTCSTCGKAFAYSNVLKNHMLTHTGEKPFLCVPCNKTFSRKHQLEQHIGTLTHQQTVKSRTGLTEEELPALDDVNIINQ